MLIKARGREVWETVNKGVIGPHTQAVRIINLRNEGSGQREAGKN